ncbi:hypothetical protein VTN31DRAFT_5773 [Thermomyces dupontii]|uniref:uncharacterized protein n=1 Tax=Talaromyces thermophilus TaxID=28565 RepID=UPI0037432910
MWWNWRPSHRTFGHQTLSRLTSRMNDELTMVDLMYDHAKEKLSYRLVDYTLPVADYSYEHVTPYMTCYWNDALKCLDICNTANGTRRMLPYRLDIREVRTYEYLHKQSRQPEFDTDEDVLQLIGGPEVLCFASRDGIQLWFFNPNFVPDIDVPFARPFVAM